MCSTHMKRFETEVINAPCHITTIEETKLGKKVNCQLNLYSVALSFQSQTLFLKRSFRFTSKVHIYFHNFTLCGIVIFQDYAVVHLFVLF